MRHLVLLLLAAARALAIPSSKPHPLPLLIWHGLGDRFDADGLHSVGELAKAVHPGTHIHYIALDESSDEDRKASFFGNVSVQIEQVCSSLHNEPALFDATTNSLRVDAIGFSQGGQFLRGLLERCDGLNVRSLVTFGSQHNGIAEFSKCGQWDFLCKGAIGLVRGNAWSEWVQENVVPAQYYRETDEESGLGSEEYLAASHFLADVNNEREERNETYVAKIAALERFVMFVFDEDTTVIPKESGWFAEVNVTSGEVTPLRERQMYKEDWIGLKELDEKGGLVFLSHPGGHMQLEERILNMTFEAYLGPDRKNSRVAGGIQTNLRQEVLEERHRYN